MRTFALLHISTTPKHYNRINHSISNIYPKQTNTMKRISLLLIALVAVASVNAQLLWKISGNGLQKPSYLFGTHHIAPISVIESTPGLTDALNNADMLYGEVDMSVLSDPSVQMQMGMATMAPQDSTLSKVMSQADMDALTKMLTELNAPVTPAMIEPLKPSAISNLLTLLISTKEFPDFDQTKQLDATLQAMATEKGKPVKGLETIQSQVDLLFNSPISEQAKSLHETLADPEKAAHMAHLMADAYMSGKLNELERLMTDPESGMTAEESERLITRRNSAWVDVLIGILPTASVIAVVGAGHLPGEKGLISLLRAKGYDVTPVEK